MKKLAIFAKSLGGGGAEVALINLLNKLDEKKFDVTLFLLDSNEEYRYRLSKDVRIEQVTFRYPFLHSLVSNEKTLGKVLKKLGINKYLPYYRWVSSFVSNSFENYDLALDFYGYGYFFTEFLGRSIKASTKATWLHDENFYWLKSVEKSLAQYDKIFCVSEAIKTAFDAQYPAFQGKSAIFYNVTDVDFIKEKAQAPRPEELVGEKLSLLSVGRLHSQKGFDLAIQAAAILAKQKQLDFNWFIIGDGPEKEELNKLISSQGLQDSVHLLGRKDNPYPYMAHCDLYVQPSRHEGYVTTILEARVLGKTILASAIPSNMEQIQDGVNGFLFDLESEKMAEVIYQVATKREDGNLIRETSLSFDEELKKLDCL